MDSSYFMKDHCSVCLSENTLVLLVDSKLQLIRCHSCTHTFTRSSKGHPEELYSEDYYLEAHKNWFNNPNLRLFKFIHGQILNSASGKPLKLVDLGCGTGDFLKYIRMLDPHIELWGVDLKTNEYPGISFIQADVVRDNIAEKEFDVICSLAVIEHLDRPTVFVKRLSDMIVPGGLVFLTTVNNDSLIYKVARFLKKFRISSAYYRLYSSHHFQHFTNLSLKILMEENGFNVKVQKNHNYPLKAVDIPKCNVVIGSVYTVAVWVLFVISTIFHNGVLQTVVCRKKNG